MSQWPAENLFLNPELALWVRSSNPDAEARCEVWRQNFAADRWKIRYAAPSGATVTQCRAGHVPEESPAVWSLEIRGAVGVTQNVFFGQRLEAADAPRYRRRLRFSVDLWLETPSGAGCAVNLVLGTAKQGDRFGGPGNDQVEPLPTLTLGELSSGRWVRLEAELDLRAANGNGLSVELEFPSAVLSQSGAVVRIANPFLGDASGGGVPMPRAAALESFLAERYFQRHSGRRVNSPSRVLAVNADELHFQFTFPPMRAFPACTLPEGDSVLRVHSLGGVPQDGFVLDVTHRSCGSVMIRARKPGHGLVDGYLAFTTLDGALLLDAEL
jgi:hypothetical protein